MKVTARIGMIVIALMVTLTVFAQNVDQAKIEQQFYTAYITSSNPAWKISLNQLADAEDESAQVLLAKGYYAAAGTAMGSQNKDLVEEMLDKAETVTKAILKKNKKSPEGNALLSSVYGMQIGLSPLKGTYLGSKSANAVEKGVDLAPDNGFTNFVMGNYLFRTPSMWGGDVKESIAYLEKSRGIYEKSAQTKNWEYMSVMALLGQAYHSEKQFDKAKAVYEVALKTAPNFSYVSKYLLPRTEKAAKA